MRAVAVLIVRQSLAEYCAERAPCKLFYFIGAGRVCGSGPPLARPVAVVVFAPSAAVRRFMCACAHRDSGVPRAQSIRFSRAPSAAAPVVHALVKFWTIAIITHRRVWPYNSNIICTHNLTVLCEIFILFYINYSWLCNAGGIDYRRPQGTPTDDYKSFTDNFSNTSHKTVKIAL